jgi:hypothetical protein
MNKISKVILFIFLIMSVSCGSGGGGGSSGPGPDPISTRFRDNGDGTVTDTNTTLMWMKNPKDITGIYGTKSWEVALSQSDTYYTMYSKAGWHLPNVREMMSLMDYTKKGPALSTGYPFKNILTSPGSYYWTSTTNKGSASYAEAWCIDMYDGSKVSVSKADPNGASMLLVRIPNTTTNSVEATGQNMVYNPGENNRESCQPGSTCRQQDGYLQFGNVWPSPRYVDIGDGTVKDRMTSLIWMKQPLSVAKTWPDAVNYCNSLGNSWRLPKLDELESMLDASTMNPAIPLAASSIFQSVKSSPYWTTTEMAGYTSNAWCIDFYDGAFSSQTKASLFYVWPVKGPVVGDGSVNMDQNDSEE